MAKTPAAKRLVIIAFAPCNLWDEIHELGQKGHEIITFPDIHDWERADLILGDRCWRMAEPLRKYLPDAVKAAQQAKKER